VRTLAPGLVGILDTPMFQFIGRVLGVAHNPGYPLYVFLTYPFSYLPIGSLAYRINLFSALLGAITVALTFLLARRLECRKVIAVAAALGLAFGQVFWSQAVIAEVYTLHAAIVAGVLLALVVWAQTGRARYYYTSIVLFAAGLGNHTTIVGFAPGMAIFAALTNRSFVFRWRTIGATIAILAAGLLQYGFILIRSLDPDAYVESRATSVGAVVDVMLGGQFRDRLFAFGWRTVLSDRLPALLERVIVPELTVPALGFAVVGGLWLLRRRLPTALLLLLGAISIMVFALNYSVVDTPVFVIPAILVLWVLSAIGVERTARFAERVAHDRAGGLVAAVALVIPVWLVVHNFTATDQSRENTSAVHLEALFDVLPDQTTLVHEDFIIDRMVTSRLVDDTVSKHSRIDLVQRSASDVRRALAAGRRVFGFRKSARWLRYQALDFSFAPVPLVAGTFRDFVSHLPRGTAVAVAIPASSVARVPAPHVSLAASGGTATADLTIEAGQPIGESTVAALATISLHAAARGAAIQFGGRDVVHTSDGAAVAVFAPDGKLANAFVLQANANFQVPLPVGPLSIYPLRGNWQGLNFAHREWRDVTGVCRTGSVMLRVPGGQTAVLYLADDRPLEPRPFDNSPGRFSTRVNEVSAGIGIRGHLYRLEIGVLGSGDASVLVALGGIPIRAFARLAPSSSPVGSATLFTLDTAGLLRVPDRSSELLVMARGEQAQLTGDGWSSVDFDIVGPYRWMTANESALVLPIAAPDATHIRVQALRRPDGYGPTSIALRINETLLPVQPMATGWRAYEWSIPVGVIREGTNEMAIVVDRPPANKTIAIADVRLERRP
jgi:hypothetical protein